MTKLMAGMDLHSNNVMVGIIDEDGKRLVHQKLRCNLAEVVGFLAPYKTRLQKIPVESTYNWYWLVDGLKALGYPAVLANPAKIQQYNGLKHTDDISDAYFLAELARLGILPEAHIYDPQLRPVRDLLRRRTTLVHHRTSLILSVGSLYTRTTGRLMSSETWDRMESGEVNSIYRHPANQLITKLHLKHIAQLNESIQKIEAVVLKVSDELPYYEPLTTIPGIGKILGLTITMEVGDIGRFASAGQFASYCRTVDAKRLSNAKKKGQNNQKCGNKYLAWAFVEAANFARRHDASCHRWYERKAAKTNRVLATKALACKLAKVAWFLMAKQTTCDVTRVCPEQATKAKN